MAYSGGAVKAGGCFAYVIVAWRLIAEEQFKCSLKAVVVAFFFPFFFFLLLASLYAGEADGEHYKNTPGFLVGCPLCWSCAHGEGKRHCLLRCMDVGTSVRSWNGFGKGALAVILEVLRICGDPPGREGIIASRVQVVSVASLQYSCQARDKAWSWCCQEQG